MPLPRLAPVRILAAAVLVGVALASVSLRAQDKKPNGRTYKDYQVAAGTHLTLELRSQHSSNTSRVNDPVRARLVRPVAHDGVELLPAGATLLGAVTDVEPAGKKQRGRIVLAFHVIEHPETGGRATIRTAVLEFASERPVKGNVFPELRLVKSGELSVSLTAPLTVRIPVKTTGASQSPNQAP